MFTGTGNIRANGGNGNGNGGGGAGGRITVNYQQGGFHSDRTWCVGGSSSTENGGPGVVYLDGKAPAMRNLRIDNKGRSPSVSCFDSINVVYYFYLYHFLLHWLRMHSKKRFYWIFHYFVDLENYFIFRLQWTMEITNSLCQEVKHTYNLIFLEIDVSKFFFRSCGVSQCPI